MTPQEVISRALRRLVSGSTRRDVTAKWIVNALAAAGYYVVADGQGVIDGAVVALERRGRQLHPIDIPTLVIATPQRAPETEEPTP